MKCTFKTKWENGKMTCVCTLNYKCTHARSCEELDFRLDKYDGLNQCMKQKSYKRSHGALRQVVHD